MEQDGCRAAEISSVIQTTATAWLAVASRATRLPGCFAPLSMTGLADDASASIRTLYDPVGLQQLMADGVGGGGGATVDAELRHDAGDVVLDGAPTDEQRLGDLGVGATVDQQSQDL